MVVINDVKIQQDVIDFVSNRIGHENIYRSIYGSGNRTDLEAALREAKVAICPTVTTRTLRRWWYFFLKHGDTPAIERRRKARVAGRRYQRRTTRGNWSPVSTTVLKSIVDDNPDLYLDEIQDEFLNLTGEWWCASKLWKELVSSCNYSLQITTERAYKEDDEERQRFLQRLRDVILHPDQLVFVDESHKDRNSSRRRRMWWKRGSSPWRNAYFAGSHSKRYSLIAACDINGFIVEACETVEHSRGQGDDDPTRGTIDTERFRLWAVEFLIPYLGDYSKGEARSIVVMDNATIHGDIEDLILATGAILIYTAPYSPDLNPIELMFGNYKSYLKRHYHLPWQQAHEEGLRYVSPERARAFFRHSKVPYCEHYPTSKEVEKQKKNLRYVAKAAIVTAAAATAIMVVIGSKRRKVV